MGQVSSIFQYGTVDSTNTVALSLARGGAPSGTLVTATAQTAGRGREGRVFHSAPGGIYTTLIVRPTGGVDAADLLRRTCRMRRNRELLRRKNSHQVAQRRAHRHEKSVRHFSGRFF